MYQKIAATLTVWRQEVRCVNKVFYPKLAFLNLKKNHKTYVPYLFTCILTVMLFYALSAIGIDSGWSR